MLVNAVRKIDSWIGRISQSLVLLCGILVMLMAVAQTYGVVMRYIFNSPDPAAYELSQLFLLLGGVLSVAGVERLDQNVRNDLISSRFPPRVHMIIVSTIFPFLALVFTAILTWKSFDNALYAARIGQVSQSPWALPLAPIKFLIPLGFALLCLVLLSKVIHGVASLKSGKYEEEHGSGDTAVDSS